jgi:hypothetical protein
MNIITHTHTHTHTPIPTATNTKAFETLKHRVVLLQADGLPVIPSHLNLQTPRGFVVLPLEDEGDLSGIGTMNYCSVVYCSVFYCSVMQYNVYDEGGLSGIGMTHCSVKQRIVV